MHSHLEESLQRDINRIREHVTEMSIRAEKALHDCVKAFVENDRKLAYAVVLRDQYIDEKEKEIDRLCLEFIVRQQPVAKPLRFAYSTIKINLEIERVGDYAESIARHILKMREKPSDGFREQIVQLANLSIAMFHDSIRAFTDQDPDLAKKNIKIEETVDIQRIQLNTLLIGLLRENKISYEVLDPLLTIVRRFERVADQARNICMEVLYMCTGEYAKHPGAEAFRVLFVDDHNSCRSQMAEAVAQSLKQNRFVFNSAGVEPKPISPFTIEFMKTKGFDLSRIAPKALHQVPNLDHYQVIVALSKGAYRAFPQHPRKVVFLDWPVEDPAEESGSVTAMKERYEKAFQFIRDQVKELVEAIIGSTTESERTCA